MRNRLVATLLPTVCAVLLPAPPITRAAAGDPPGAADRVELTERLMADFQSAAGIPGLALAVVRNGRQELSLQLGSADVEQDVAVTRLTRFRLGSLSKALTATLMMKLAEQGAIDLDASITTRLPTLPETYRPITPRLLAAHLAGIRHYREDESTNRLPIRETEASLARFVDDPLLHPPGTAYEYSSYGYVLLGAVLESACGRSYQTCLEEEVLGPLGLESITADHPDRIVPYRTRFYERDREGLRNAPYSDRIYKLAAGGHLGTVTDLARFGWSLVSGDLLQPTSTAALLTSRQTSSGEPTGYGMGFRPDEDWEGRRIAHHGGSAEGGRAFLMIYPEHGLVVAFAANLGRAPFFQQEAWTIASLWLDSIGNELGDGEWSAIEGIYDVRAGDPDTQGDVTTGVLYLLARTAPDHGWLVLDGERPTRIRLSLARRRDGVIWLSGSGRQGMLNLWLEPADAALVGEWNWFGKTRAVEGTRRAPG